MNRDDKELIASELETLAEDIRNYPNAITDIRIDLTIKELFEVMVQLREYKRGIK